MNSSHSHKLLYKIPRDSLVPLWVMNEASLSFFNPSLLSGSIGRPSKGGGHIYEHGDGRPRGAPLWGYGGQNPPKILVVKSTKNNILIFAS